MKLLTTPEERKRYIEVGDHLTGIVEAAQDVDALIALLAHTYHCVSPDSTCSLCSNARDIILEHEGA